MKFKILFLTLLISALSWGQTTIAAWTFPTAIGTAPTTLAAECGVFSATSNFYADGTNGSSNWSAGTYFGGTAPTASLCGVPGEWGGSGPGLERSA